MFLDDTPVTACLSYPVVGKCENYAAYVSEANFFVAIVNAKVRKGITEMLEGAGATLATLVHPLAVIGEGAVLGAGTVVMAGAVINPDAKVGKGCIINTCASVHHDCVLSDYVHVAVGAHLAGEVTVGASTWIGAGAVVKNIDLAGNHIGVPAKTMR